MAAESYGQWEGLATDRDKLVSSNWFNSINAHLQAQQLANQVEQARLNRNLQAYLQGLSMSQENRLNDANQALNWAKLQTDVQKSALDRDFQRENMANAMDLSNRQLNQRQAKLNQPSRSTLENLQAAVKLAGSGSVDPVTVGSAFGATPEQLALLKQASDDAKQQRSATFEQIKALNTLANMGLKYEDPNSDESKALKAASGWFGTDWFKDKDYDTLNQKKNAAINALNSLRKAGNAEKNVLYDPANGQYKVNLPSNWGASTNQSGRLW